MPLISKEVIRVASKSREVAEKRRLLLLHEELADVMLKRNDPSFSYATWHMNVRRLEVLSDELKGHVEAGLALDVGCGDGFFTYALSKKFKISVGVDLSPAMLSKSKELGSRNAEARNTFFVVADAECLPFRNESFDCVLAMNIFAIILDAHAALTEISRVTKRKGLALIEILNRFSPLILLRKIGRIFVGSSWSKRVDSLFGSYFSGSFTFRAYSRGEVKRLTNKLPLRMSRAKRYLLVGTQFPKTLVRVASPLEAIIEPIPILRRLTLMTLYCYLKS